MDKLNPTSVTVVTDCSDANAAMRQKSRLATLFPGAHITVCGAQEDAAIALNVVDAVDAILGSPTREAQGIVIANGAPRNGAQPNGSRFGWCDLRHEGRRVLLITTVDGSALSLLLRIADLNPQVFATATAVSAIGLSSRLLRPQFRSYEIVPAVAWHLARGGDLPSHSLEHSIPWLPYSQVAWVDNFGNCKTTIMARDVPWMQPGKEVGVTINASDRIAFTCYDTLTDAPVGELAIVVGSSGLGDRDTRFLELVIKMGSCAERLGLRVGVPITI